MVMVLKTSLPARASTVTACVSDEGVTVSVSTPAVPSREVPPAPLVVEKAKVPEEKMSH